MPEKIKNNLGIILNVITSLIVIGSLIYQMGIQKGKIDELERNQAKSDVCVTVIQTDLKLITASISAIENKINIIEEKMKIKR